MAFDLSSPTAQLAFGVAQRAQEVQNFKNDLEARARQSVNAQLTPYGNDLSQFDSTFKSIYDPVAATQQARAKAMQEYVTGLPELLARIQAEKASTGGGGGDGTIGGGEYQFDPQGVLQYIIGNPAKSPYTEPYSAALNTMRNRGVRPGAIVTATTQRPIRGIGWTGQRNGS